jgi:hypothetical protein
MSDQQHDQPTPEANKELPSAQPPLARAAVRFQLQPIVAPDKLEANR